MDISPQIEVLFNSPVGIVLDHLLQHPESEDTDAEISRAIKRIKKSAVNIALRKLSDAKFIERRRRGRMVFNRLLASPLIIQMKIVSNLVSVQPLVEELASKCTKIILFGSRADGTHRSESDFDLFVVTNERDQIIIKKKNIENLQIVQRTPEQMLTFSEDEPAFSNEVRKGIVLWEKR